MTQEQSEFAQAMMNLLSMDFSIEERFADLLRHNSFRRARRQRRNLGQGFLFAIHPRPQSKDFSLDKSANRSRFIHRHGSSILDFGAGHLQETRLLRQAGLRVTPFEPYHIADGNDIDKQASLAICREFIDDVANGIKWSSIFISSVLNSVPFLKDRLHIVTILAALCHPSSTLYAFASSRRENGWQQMLGRNYLNEVAVNQIAFRLDYEPGIRIGDFQDKPKVQKYHTPAELFDLFSTAFRRVESRDLHNNAAAIASQPKPIDTQALLAAIRFEFDLPYPDGSRMDLVEPALHAFSQRLGINLRDPD